MSRPRTGINQRQRTRLLLLGTAGLSALVLACGTDDKSGACPGTMDGRYFKLQMFNFDDSDSVSVRVNGRFMGSIPRAVTLGTGLNPGEGLFGIFPVCDKMEISAEGGRVNNNRICSTAVFLSPGCHDSKEDNCWETFGVTPDGQGNVTFPANKVKSPQCEDAANPSDPCLGSWVSC